MVRPSTRTSRASRRSRAPPQSGHGQVAAIAAQEHADVHLVLLALEPAEEAADAVVVLVALDDERALLVGQIDPRHVEPDARLARRALQLRQLRAVVRLAPRLDGALVDRLRRIGHDQIHVELDDVAEAVAGRAGAERVVEREQPRLRLLVGDAAGAAFEPLGEHQPARRSVGPIERSRRPERSRTPRRRLRGTTSRSSR